MWTVVPFFGTFHNYRRIRYVTKERTNIMHAWYVLDLEHVGLGPRVKSSGWRLTSLLSRVTYIRTKTYVLFTYISKWESRDIVVFFFFFFHASRGSYFPRVPSFVQQPYATALSMYVLR